MAITDKLTAIANAIRAKTGKTESLTLEQMPTEIESITTGGGSSDDVRYVTFRNEATGEEFVKPVATGDDCVDVVAKGLWAKPTKPSDAQYDYTFYGWGASDGGAADSTILQNITEDKTVYAIFTATVKYYTITYYDEDGTTVLKTESLAYGAMPSYSSGKTKDNYTAVWSPSVEQVTGDASYTLTWVENAVTWDLTDGVLTISGYGPMDDYESGTTPWYDDGTTITKVIIKDGVTHIGNFAFYGTKVVGAEIPNSVTSIGGQAFLYCSTLTSCEIPSSVTSIGLIAFCGTGITSVTIPGGMTFAGTGVFRDCKSLTSVVIQPGVTHIGSSAFSGCTALESVIIHSGVTTFGSGVFQRCTALKSVTLPDTVTDIDINVFNGCSALESINVPASVKYIGANAFPETLQSVTFEPTGYWYVKKSTDTNYTTTYLNASNALGYLTSTYIQYYWYRTKP